MIKKKGYNTWNSTQASVSSDSSDSFYDPKDTKELEDIKWDHDSGTSSSDSSVTTFHKEWGEHLHKILSETIGLDESTLHTIKKLYSQQLVWTDTKSEEEKEDPIIEDEFEIPTGL